MPLCKDDLRKLTIPQLKKLCKEASVVGYSKLNKDAIIAKLLAKNHDTRGSIAAGENSTTASCVAAGDEALHDVTAAVGSTKLGTIEDTSGTAILARQSTDGRVASLVHRQGQPEKTVEYNNPTDSSSPSIPSKRAASDTTNMNANKDHKKKKPDPMSAVKTTMPVTLQAGIQTTSAAALSVESESLSSCELVSLPNEDLRVSICARPEGTDAAHLSPTGFKSTEAPPGDLSSTDNIPAVIWDLRKTPQQLQPSRIPRNHVLHAVQDPPNRYKRLIPVDKQSHPRLSTVIPELNARTNHHSKSTNQMILYAQAVYLDFPTHNAIPLRPILGIPPSVSQRKHVPLLSVVLSGLSFEDLRTCSLVSRAFRFSAYAAAVHQLQRKYPGSRSNDVLSQYAHQTTNFWPYLNLRNDEAHKRRLVYEASFLHRAMQGICTIDDRLWSSPDNEKQINIAVRFLLTRLFFFVSIGHPIHQGGSEQLHSVLDAREIVKDEVWEITSRSHKPSKEVFYVLESTCEVIGSGADSNNMAADKRIREDWHMHINNAKENTPHRKSLMDCLQWSNYEEYTGGISKLWLKRVQVEGELGAMKLIVAKRYVMACVMGNSISGSWRSAAAMAHEFEGKTTTIPIFSPKRFKLNLYLPFHHHVESVHFLSRNGKALHPAVAVIQTPGREYYILKDIGMQIGCEEEGIAPVWMKLLPCTGSGGNIE